MAMGMLWILNIVFAVVCVALLAILLYVYGRNASQIHSKFALGLVVFAVLFLVENVVGLWAYFTMSAVSGAEVALPMLLLNAMETGALATLVVITWD